jgi:hypothetical protein
MLVMHFVDADGVIAGPLAIVEAFAESESAFVECGSDGQVDLLLRMRGGIIVGWRGGEQGKRVYPLPPFFVSMDSKGVRGEGGVIARK